MSAPEKNRTLARSGSGEKFGRGINGHVSPGISGRIGNTPDPAFIIYPGPSGRIGRFFQGLRVFQPDSVTGRRAGSNGFESARDSQKNTRKPAELFSLRKPMKRSNRTSTLMLAICFITGCVLAARIEANEGLNSIFGGNTTSSLPAYAMTGERFKALLDQIPADEKKQLSDTAWEMTITYKDISFPALVHTNEKGNAIWARYNLAAIPENARPEEYTPYMLELMAKSGTFGDSFFSYDSEHRMIQVWGCIQVRSEVTVQELANHLIMLAEMSIETQSLWNPAQWGQDTPRHAGQWNAAANGMVLVLDIANRFELRVNNNVTRGSYTIDGDSLSLVDDRGEKIDAQVRFDNANQFTLMVNGNEIGFVRM
jgi:hypothetical protein